MNRPSRRFALALCLWLSVALACPIFAGQVTKHLAPGVSLYQEVNTEPTALVINAVSVDPTNPSVALKSAIGKDIVYVDDVAKGRETISSLTARRGALVGINSDFFPFTGDPLGVCIADGELISEPGFGRVAVAVSANGGAFFDNPRLDARLTLSNGVSRQIDGINRERETNQVVVYTPTFGVSTRTKYKATDIVATTQDLPVRVGKPMKLTVADVRADATNTPIPAGGVVVSAGGPAAWFLAQNLKVGDTLTVQFDLKSATDRDWTQVRQATGGGPWLLKDGQQFIDYEAEAFSAGFSTTRHPRTALGITADGKLLLVTVDGRQVISGGISLPDLSALMKRLGAVNAINLDGGGSTSMSVAGMVVNAPSEGIERAVSNGLLVMAAQPAQPELPKLTVSGVSAPCPSGEPVQLFLTWGDDAQMLTQEQLDRVVWGATGGIGLVGQDGVFRPIKPGKGTIKARYGQQVVSLDTQVVPGAPSAVKAVLTPDKTSPLLAALAVTVNDRSYNKLAGQQVMVEVVGGVAGSASGTTDEKGQFTTPVTWDAASTDRSVRVTVGGIAVTAALEPAK